MAKNITIRVSDEVAHWARRKAADGNTSISRLVSQMVERQMRLTDEYWAAFERWKQLVPSNGVPGVNASQRWTREQIHEHRR